MNSQLRRIGSGALVAVLVAVTISGAVAWDSGNGKGPADPGIEWVVGGRATSRGSGGTTYSLICVPAGEVGLDSAEWSHVREVQTDKATSYDRADGTPCPEGRILFES